MEIFDKFGVQKAISLEANSPSEKKNKPNNNPKIILPLEINKEEDEKSQDSLMDESPLPDKTKISSSISKPAQENDYDYWMNYNEYPNIFDFLPTKTNEDDDGEDDSYLWQQQNQNLLPQKNLIIDHVQDEKEDSEEDKKRKEEEKDREPNFFINGEGYRFARNSLFCFGEDSRARYFVLNYILYAKYFKYILLFFLILNLVAYGLYDFTYRLKRTGDRMEPDINLVANNLEFVCNIFFTFEIVLKMISMGVIFQSYAYLRTREGFVNFILFLLNWILVIRINEHYNSSTLNFLLILRALRILRVLRILFVFGELRLTIISLINTIPYMARTFLCLIIVFVFYTIWGLHFFSGAEEYRCRTTPEPQFVNGSLYWPVSSVPFRCGYWECPENTYCGSPNDYNMNFDIYELNYEMFNWGATTFNNFFEAFFVVLHFLFLVGWSSLTYSYWRVADGTITAFFFGSLALFGFFIMVNLFLASVYDSFMLHSSIKDKKNKQKQPIEEKKEEPNFFLNLGNIQKSANTSPSKKPKKHIRQTDMKVSTIPLVSKFTTVHHSKTTSFVDCKEALLKFFENQCVRRCISFLIVCDLLVLCLNDQYRSHSDMILLNQFDFFFFCCFFVEVTAKLFATGLIGLKKSFIFTLDVAIIYANLIVIIYELAHDYNIFENGSKAGMGIRAFKMIRIFRVIYYTQMFSSLSILMRALLRTLYKMKQFYLIMASLVIVFALMGMELFSNRARFIDTHEGLAYDLENGLQLRPNFDNFFNSFESIMLILYNEEWHVTMYMNIKAVGPISYVFYWTVVFIAQIMILKLLVALFLRHFIDYIKSEIIEDDGDFLKILKMGFKRRLLNLANYINNKEETEALNNESKFKSFKTALINKIINFSKNLDEEAQEEENEKKPEITENPIFSAIRKTINPDVSLINPISDITERRLVKKSICENSPQFLIKPIEKENVPKNGFKIFFQNIVKKSLMIFPSESRIRKLLKIILNHWAYETFILFVVFLSSLILVIWNPLDDPNSVSQVILNSLDQVVTIIYGIDFLMNAIAYGFVWGKDTYLRRSVWNLLDFAVFIFCLVGIIVPRDQLKINSMKVFRVIRILKVGQKNPGIRVATQALISALPNILKLVAFSFIFILAFALFGMTYLKGKYYSCYSLDQTTLTNYIKTKNDCFDYGGDWIRNEMHFDTIIASVNTLFQVATSEGWLSEMHKAVDATYYDHQPITNFNEYWVLYYLTYFFVGNFMVMSMFIAVIVETYLDQKGKASKFNLLTEEQKEWALIKTSILKMKPKKKKLQGKWKFQDKIMRFKKWKPVKYLYNLCIATNIVILGLYYHRQPKERGELLDRLNLSMICIITFFYFLRVLCCVSFKKFIYSRNTIIFTICLILSYVSFGISNSDKVLNSLAKASQTILAYKILKNFNIIQRVFHTLFFVLPSLSNIVSLMLLILYIYAVIANDIFSYLRPQKTVNGYDVDFKSFPKALFSLFRIMTTELWWSIANDCTRERAPNFACLEIRSYEDYAKYGLNGCGSGFYYIFFYTYHLFFSLIILNLLIVTIIVSYGEVFNAEQRAIDRFQLVRINDLWTHFDPMALGYINYKDFWTLASKIAVVFGVSERDLLEVKNKKNFINILKIPLYENRKEKVFCYKFHDVIVRLAEISVTIKYGVVDLEPPQEEKLDTDKGKDDDSNLKLAKKVKKTENKNTLFIKTGFHSGHMASMMIIYNKIRKWVKKAKKIDDKINDIQGFHDFLKKKRESEHNGEKKKIDENEERKETNEQDQIIIGKQEEDHLVNIK